jgi:hypothetical protein
LETSSSFQKFNHHIKSKRRRQHINIDSKGILKQSEPEEAPNRQEVMGPISIQVSSASLQWYSGVLRVCAFNLVREGKQRRA